MTEVLFAIWVMAGMIRPRSSRVRDPRFLRAAPSPSMPENRLAPREMPLPHVVSPPFLVNGWKDSCPKSLLSQKDQILLIMATQDASLDNAQLNDASLDYAELQDASFKGTWLQGASLNYAELQGASFENAQMEGASLINSQLQGARFDDAILTGAEFGSAELSGASFKNADLTGASLNAAQLQGASLMAARMRGASLSGASLQGVSFYDPARPEDLPDLSDAYLSEINVWRTTPGGIFDGALIEQLDPEPHCNADSKCYWSDASYAELKTRIEQVPPGSARDEALRRIAPLGIKPYTADTISAKRWLDLAEVSKSSAATYPKRLADDLIRVGCNLLETSPVENPDQEAQFRAILVRSVAYGVHGLIHQLNSRFNSPAERPKSRLLF